MPATELVTSYSQLPIAADKQLQLVAALWVEELKMYRIVKTSIINNSKEINFLVDGKNKASAVQQVIEAQYQPEKYQRN